MKKKLVAAIAVAGASVVIGVVIRNMKKSDEDNRKNERGYYYG